ncbi:MAG: small multi-drug export protein [Bacteroidetes bacterium]|nr:small multi-drug export protein [Bacteroidota bacterium]
MSEFVKILLIILLSSVKFVAGPPFAYFDDRYDFSFFETVFYCVIGGMLGVLVFTFFSIEIQLIFNWLKKQIKRAVKKPQLFSQPKATVENIEFVYNLVEKDQPKKVFTPTSRKFVKIWNRYGLPGVAFLTPIIFSIPLGTIIANAFEDNKKKIFLYMFFSILFWSLVLTSIFELYHVVSIPELKEKIIG